MTGILAARLTSCWGPKGTPCMSRTNRNNFPLAPTRIMGSQTWPTPHISSPSTVCMGPTAGLAMPIILVGGKGKLLRLVRGMQGCLGSRWAAPARTRERESLKKPLTVKPLLGVHTGTCPAHPVGQYQLLYYHPVLPSLSVASIPHNHNHNHKRQHDHKP
jgi:hypothetical protein